jgi:hypothetical protein
VETFKATGLKKHTKDDIMKYTFLLMLWVSMSTWADGYDLYQTNKYGSRDYSKQGYVVEKESGVTTITPVNKYGTKDYSKPGYKVEGDEIYRINKYGTRDYSKPEWKME